MSFAFSSARTTNFFKLKAIVCRNAWNWFLAILRYIVLLEQLKKPAQKPTSRRCNAPQKSIQIQENIQAEFSAKFRLNSNSKYFTSLLKTFFKWAGRLFTGNFLFFNWASGKLFASLRHLSAIRLSLLTSFYYLISETRLETDCYLSFQQLLTNQQLYFWYHLHCLNY